MIDDLAQLWQYLTNLDLVGFIIACYTTRIASGFWMLLMAMFSLGLYLRTRSATYCVILWMLASGLGWILTAPNVSLVTQLFTGLAISGLVIKLYLTWK